MSDQRGQGPSGAVPSSSSDAQTWSLFLLLSLMWGGSYLFIKLALDEGVAPLTLVSLRTVLGTLFLGIVMLVVKGRLPRSGRAWFDLGVVGMTNVVVPYALIAWGELHISTGMTGIVVALAPLFTVVLATFVLREERLTAVGIGGVVVGFLGVALLALPSLSTTDGADGALPIAGMVAVGLAALSYAVALVYTRRRLTGRPLIRTLDGARPLSVLEIAFGQVFVAMIVISALAMTFERPEGSFLALPEGFTAIFAIVWLGILGTGVAYLLYFALIDRWGATRASLIAYVMPIVSIALGFIILDERLRPAEIAGATLIIGGVVLVNARPRPKPVPVEVNR